MPIKFRCSHCRQLLGIAHSKAGEIVDCPTCGRAIRVPRLDGRIEPIPVPALDLHDSVLAHALNELAAIGDFPEEADEEDQQEQPFEPLEIPLLALTPAVVELPPLQPATPVEWSSNGSLGDLHDSPSDEARQGQHRDALRDLLPPSPAELTPPSPSVRSRRWWPITLCALGAIGAVALGFVLGRLNSSSEADSETEQPNAAAAAVAGVAGRLMTWLDSGTQAPDAGGVILALPIQNPAGVRLSALRFQPGVADAEFAREQQALVAAGGAAALADANGDFRLPLAAGAYWFVLISRHQQSQGDPPDESVDQLGTWFEQPRSLWGQREVFIRRVEYSGAGPAWLNYCFPPGRP